MRRASMKNVRTRFAPALTWHVGKGSFRAYFALHHGWGQVPAGPGLPSIFSLLEANRSGR